MNTLMDQQSFFRWLDEQIPDADELRKENPWFAYEAAKRQVKSKLARGWKEYDYYQSMITYWAGVAV